MIKKLKCSISKNFEDKGNLKGSDLSSFAYGFEPYEVTIEQLETGIKLGLCFSYQFRNEHRQTINFAATDFLAVDMDGAVSIEECLAEELVKDHCTLFYTTASHTPEVHRFRLVFVLPRTITKATELKYAARALSVRLSGDMSATDAARMFYGSKNCRSQILGNTISSKLLGELIEDGKTVPVSDRISPNSNPAAARSSRKLNPLTLISLPDGTKKNLDEFREKASVYCPMHNDKTASAFVGFGRRDAPFLHCKTCQTTWWMEGAIFSGTEFDSFEKYVVGIKEGKATRDFSKISAFERIVGSETINARHITLSSDKYLKLDTLQDGLTLIKSPKGSGKTTFLAKTLHKIINRYRSFEEYEEDTFGGGPEKSSLTDEKILLIGHRQALIGELCERLQLNSYLDDKNLSNHANIARRKRYGICLDSLWRLADAHYDLIVIDEVEQVLSHFLSDTIDQKRETLFVVLCSLLRKAKRVVALDADLGWLSYHTLFTIISTRAEGRYQKPIEPVRIFLNERLDDERSMEIYPNQNQLINRMKHDILSGNRVFITSNSKRKIKILTKIVAKLAEDAPIEIPFLSITSDNSRTKEIQKFINNIKDEILNYKVVLTSPSLGTGIDITFDNDGQEIDSVIGFFENQINTHFEIDQQLARVRHPKKTLVWVSPRSFSFETNLDVVKDEYLRSQLRFGMESGLSRNQDNENREIPLFYEMAAISLAQSRASKNNLRHNFIVHKKDQKFKINFVPSDEILSKTGAALLNLAKDETEREEVENILSATTMNNYRFRKFQLSIEDNNSPSDEAEWNDFRRTHLEIFYGETVSEALVIRDRRGDFRRQILAFEALSRDPTFDDLPDADGRYSESQTVQNARLKIVKDKLSAAVFLSEVLSTTPIFSKGHFETALVLKSVQLHKFAETCLKMKHYIETQLGISIRKDVLDKPVQQLNAILKIVGMKLEKLNTEKRAGKKIYLYRISETLHSEMLAIVKRRSIYDNVSWPFVDRTYNFQYSEEQVEWLVEH